ncbi:unnamed protein product [Moneuplotes crassus]|uniref:Uncharacterized protein n=1 Tax=Euplotes crassus TaxID=5936 RepID=A0AAD1UUL7_EUPCR|nr:unnamed protein product [Moneuplotes crassus]
MAYSKTMIYLAMTGMVLSGAGSGIAIKLTNSTVSLGSEFHHPFFQCLTMFLGEVCCMVFAFYSRYQDKKKYGSFDKTPEYIEAEQKGMKVKYNPLVLAIPMLCDSLASLTVMIGYIHIAASIAQMIGSFIVFVTAVEAIIFLKQKLYKHHYVGAFLVVFGIICVAYAAFSTENEVANGNTFIGVTAMIISAIMQGTQFVIEDKIVRTYYSDSFEFAGWEGIWGTLLCLIVLPIFQFIPCEGELCSDGYIENSIFALQQIANSPRLIFLTIFTILIICAYNGIGLLVTKMVSSPNRVILRQIKIVVIWIFFLIYPYEGGESFKIIQLIGFAVLVFGVFLYNEVIIIHHCGLADHLSIQKDKEDVHSENYIEFQDSNAPPNQP